MQEISKFNLELVSVIPNGLEKLMTFLIYENFVFTDSMQFMKSN